MKKIIASLLILTIVVGMFGCGGSKKYVSIENAKLVTEYSSDTMVDKMDTVIFGSYPQSDASGNKKDPIEWIVIDKNGERALLLSKYILDCKCYNNEYKDVTWETCDLRKWLNNDFFNIAFTDSEKEKIVKIKNKNKDNSKYHTKGGKDTSDKIFCLSISQIEKYFKQSDMRSNNYRLATKGTKYAQKVDNAGSNLHVEGGNSYFWLRSPGDDQFSAAVVIDGGRLFTPGFSVNIHYNGVRPALWVKY